MSTLAREQRDLQAPECELHLSAVGYTVVLIYLVAHARSPGSMNADILDYQDGEVKPSAAGTQCLCAWVD